MTGRRDLDQQRPELDLDDFRRLTDRGISNRPADPTFEERRALIHSRFPVTRSLAQPESNAAANWVRAFDEDPELLGRLLRDILQEERATGQRGRRFGLDLVRDSPALDRLRGLDPSQHPYSLLPFTDSLGLLMGPRTIRGTAKMLDWPVTKVQRLRAGQVVPSMLDLEHIAKRFGHHPAYFSEYRVWAINEALVAAMGRQPDVSIALYERLWRYASRAGGKLAPIGDALLREMAEEAKAE